MTASESIFRRCVDAMRRRRLVGFAFGTLMALDGCAMLEPATNLAQIEALARPANTFALAPGQAEVGSVDIYVARAQDTLLHIARAYDVGYTQLMIANPGIDPWHPGEGRRVVVPTRYLVPKGPRRGIVVNLAQQRLFYFPADGGSVETYPIAVADEGQSTPIGTTRVTAKEMHPTWHPPASIRAEQPDLPPVVGPGPFNPLGDYAFRLGWASYLIHGTNNPDAIGRNWSHGCLQLYPEDIERLFREVPVGTPVRVMNEEIEAAWIDDDLYVSVYPNKDQAQQIDIDDVEPMTPSIPRHMKSLLVTATAGHRLDRIDWRVVDKAALERTGVPVRVTVPVSTTVQAQQ
jgi:L,D-transpeptidase ErfK/SrfK